MNETRGLSDDLLCLWTFLKVHNVNVACPHACLSTLEYYICPSIYWNRADVWLEMPFISHLFDSLTTRISSVASFFPPQHKSQKPFSPICTMKKKKNVWCKKVEVTWSGSESDGERQRWEDQHSRCSSNAAWLFPTRFCCGLSVFPAGFLIWVNLTKPVKSMSRPCFTSSSNDIQN